MEAVERLIKRAGGMHRRSDEFAIILLRHETGKQEPELYMTVTANIETHAVFIKSLAEGLELQLSNPRPAEPGNSNTPV